MKYILGLLLASLLLNNVEASKFPKCSDCTVYATGKDGVLWGWEGDSFCRISSSKCGITVTKTTSIRKTTTATKKSTKKESASKKTSKKTTKKTTTTKATAATTKPSTPSYDANGNLVCEGCVITATGGDKSLWGWENQKSCIIDENKCKGKLVEEKKDNKNDGKKVDASTTHKKDAQGNLLCNGCNVTATGGDNSLWGWEDEESCKIDEVLCKLKPAEPEKTTTPAQRGKDGILICSTCEYTELKDDTTTWNTENGEKCRVIGSRCNINKTPHPWCSGCVITAYGGDGAAYGWENEASCLVNEVSCGYVSLPGENTGNSTISQVNGNNKVEIESSAQTINHYYVATVTLVVMIIATLF